MTSCAWPRSARGRTRAIRDRPTRRPISTCGGSSTAKPTNIGTKARSPLLPRVAGAAPAVLRPAVLRPADLRPGAAGNNALREVLPQAHQTGPRDVLFPRIKAQQFA